MSRIKSVKKWHSLFLWPALIATLIYIFSALSHPIMVWTGPQAKKMFPPSLVLQGNEMVNISKIVEKNKLEKAQIAKFVPYKEQVLFQITQGNDLPRRYFSNVNYTEIENHDKQQAIWLAQHYLAQDLSVISIKFQSQFDEQYPQVNRLLPVYKINYDTEDNLTVFVHTETQALAAITNDWKRSLRWVFQNLHSFEFLSNSEGLRVGLIAIMVSLISLMAITGIMFIILLKRNKKVIKLERRWHRRVAYIVVLPLILFSVSGIYHLLHMSLEDNKDLLVLDNPSLPLENWLPAELPSALTGKKINQISLVRAKINNDIKNLYRISASVAKPLQENNRKKRFKGAASESRGYYLDSQSGLLLESVDLQVVKQKAKDIFTGYETSVTNTKLLTYFGPSYDFRNKRLPVWQVESQTGLQVFVDPITSMVIDQNNVWDRTEGYSFSFLHKWNFLVPLTGRFYRDVTIVLVLSLALLLSLFGLLIYLKRKKSVEAKELDKNEMLTS
ncbi:MAG: PepSY domain-containing protein [Bermanella sp.]